MAELVREILIDASPETIFEFLVDPEKHRQWEGAEVELDPRPGGVYRVLFAGQYQAAGEYVEIVQNERVVVTFGWEDSPVAPGSTRVEFRLIRDGDKTLVRLTHSDLPDEAVDQHVHGWDHYLGRLALAASGNDVGPDSGPGAG